MAFFGRKGSPPAPLPPEPIVITDTDLAAVPHLFRRFEDSQVMGSDASARHAALAIAVAAGTPALEDAMRNGFGGRDLDFDRPWRWLAAVATEAQRRRDFDLIAHLCFFTHFWATSIAPHMTLADQMDTRLQAPPSAQLAQIYEIGLKALQNMPTDHLIVNQSDVQINVLTVSVLVAREVPALSHWISPETLALAAQYQQ